MSGWDGARTTARSQKLNADLPHGQQELNYCRHTSLPTSLEPGARARYQIQELQCRPRRLPWELNPPGQTLHPDIIAVLCHSLLRGFFFFFVFLLPFLSLLILCHLFFFDLFPPFLAWNVLVCACMLPDRVFRWIRAPIFLGITEDKKSCEALKLVKG